MSIHAKFEHLDLLGALDALTTPLFIYRGETELVFANKAARDHWPFLFGRMMGGATRQESLREEVATHFAHASEAKFDEMYKIAEAALRGSVDIDFPASRGRLMRTEHFPFGEDMTLGISVDVTELRARERELKAALKDASRANQAKTDFLAKMTHEIRTPMNGVLGIAELLDQTSLDETQKLYVETIRKSSSALLGIVNEVLDLSRIEAGAVELQLTPFDPQQLLAEVVDLLAPNAHTSGLLLSNSTIGEAPDLVIGDYGKLRQVLINLVGNAIKFTKEGGVLASLNCIQTEGDEWRVTYAVEDTGPGISEKDQMSIFERYHRAEGADDETGAGLGLAISKALVSSMGGKISVVSTLGEGARFVIEFAMTVPKASEAPRGEAVIKG